MFSLPASYRYNFLSDAISSLGYQHTDESRALISKANSGANNPMYGKLSGNAMMVFVYSLDNVLVRSFTSQVAAF